MKKPHPIDDNTSIPVINPPQPIVINWNTCVICGLDLSKKGKKYNMNGTDYMIFGYKKHFRLCDRMICWNCVFNLVKEFKSSH